MTASGDGNEKLFDRTLARLLAREGLTGPETRAAFEAILAGAWTPVQIAGFAVALRMNGETAEAIAGAVEAMREAMAAVTHDLPRVVDTCGTGGDGAHTLNISSASAVVVAACGYPVAKHGNRPASSRCGSADVFEALGVPLDVPVDRQADVLKEAGITFLFAQAHHPALKHAGPTRKELRTRTIFNVLGPLANPARATHQLLGVYADSLRQLVAEALGRLGAKGAWVVHGEDGLDEISPSAPTRVSELTAEGTVRELVVTPEDFVLRRLSRADIMGGDVQENARALRAILAGEPHPATEAVILNAAAALVVASGREARECAEQAREALRSRATLETLERWRVAAQRAKQPAQP